MKILSDFKDYYDFAGYVPYDGDAGRVYVRKARTGTAAAKFETFYPPCADPYTRLRSTWWDARRRPLKLAEAPERLRLGCLFVCGKAYPFLFLRGAAIVGSEGKLDLRLSRVFDAVSAEREEQPPNRPYNFFHTYFSPEELFADFTVTHDVSGWTRRWLEQSRISESQRFFAYYKDKDFTPLHLTLDSPLLLTVFDREGSRAPDGSWRYRFVLDPALNELEFMRVVPGATVRQELEAFLGNVLVKDRMPPAPQTDRQKLLSHGFDAVTSFRKTKE